MDTRTKIFGALGGFVFLVSLVKNLIQFSIQGVLFSVAGIVAWWLVINKLSKDNPLEKRGNIAISQFSTFFVFWVVLVGIGAVVVLVSFVVIFSMYGGDIHDLKKILEVFWS